MSTFHFKYFFSLLLWTACSLANAQTFELNENCDKALEAFYQLRLVDALDWIELEQETNPNNLLPVLIENYIEVIIVFLDEQDADLENYDQNKNDRLELIKNKGDKSSPFYLYTQAEIKLQSAIARIKFEQYLSAAWEIRQAFILLKSNQKKFPSFYPNLKSLGILHALVGTVPDSYKWILKILGMSGTVDQGMEELELFLTKAKTAQNPFFKEAQIIHTFFLIYLDTQYERAIQTVKNEFNNENGLLEVLIASNIAYRLGRVDWGIQILENKPQSEAYFYVPYLDYMLGSLKLYRQDSNAKNYLSQFVQNFKGKHYIKDAYQKLAYDCLINDDLPKYNSYMSKCLSKGKTLIDIDKKANSDAKNGIIPDVELLKARLLFDGGYHSKALEVLENIDVQKLDTEEKILEYNYRFARTYEGLNSTEKSVNLYKKTIAEANNSNYYFAPKSALQLGIIYERTNKLDSAKIYFKKALSYNDYPYEDSLEQQAKAGLSRVR